MCAATIDMITQKKVISYQLTKYLRRRTGALANSITLVTLNSILIERVMSMAKAELASYINSLHNFDLSDFGSNFEKRLELQKVVYLLQEAGADLGYHFGWYVHGPYSSSLADDAYPLSTSGNFLKTFQRPINERAMTKFKGLIESLPKAKKRTYWLELLSSVHYVTIHSFPVAKTKKEAINSILKAKRGKFSPQDISKAYDLLENKSFI